MGRTVVIAEKPSVGRDIARVLGCQSSGRGCLTGGDWVVTWAVGHLVTLVEPDELDEKYKRWSFDTLPILPAEIPLKVIASSRDQFAVVRNLINAPETDRLICATDAGREGELIFRYIYEKAGCKKPFDRLWISSMTDEAIRAGFAARGAAPTGRALVIGNGGAARAARWALADRGVITAARRGGDVTMDQLPQAARQCRVVVNATPLGMEGFPPFADLSFLGSLPAGAAVFDLIYAPRKTELYQAARARGLIAITGMELLVQQAILAFNHFTGAGLEQEATRRELLALVNET